MRQFIYIIMAIIIFGGCSLQNRTKGSVVSNSEVTSRDCVQRDTIIRVDSSSNEVMTVILTPKDNGPKFKKGADIKLTDKYFNIDAVIYQTASETIKDTAINATDMHEVDSASNRKEKIVEKNCEKTCCYWIAIGMFMVLIGTCFYLVVSTRKY